MVCRYSIATFWPSTKPVSLKPCRTAATPFAAKAPSCLGSLEVDHQLELRRLHDWQVGRFLTFENAGGIQTQLVVATRQARTITHQAARPGEFTPCVDSGQAVTSSQCDKLISLAGEE